jgi:hypothetical protein
MTSTTPSRVKSGAPDRRRASLGVSLDTARRQAGRVLAEPLAQFVLAGLALFLAGQLYRSQTDLHRIVITPAHVNQLANDYALQFGARPDGATLNALVQRDIHDEILFRQGLALKLDQGDQIVRRRVVQKMQFLLQDLHPPAEPTEAELRAYYGAHAAHFVLQPKVSFTHIYFSSDTGGDAAARARAEAVLKRLPPGVARAPERGDAFPDLYDFSSYEPEQIYRLFGRSPFSEATLTAPPGRWVGPLHSGYGWHLLYVDSRRPAEQPPLSAVRDAVRSDDLQEAQDRANDRAFDGLARAFRVVRADRANPP